LGAIVEDNLACEEITAVVRTAWKLLESIWIGHEKPVAHDLHERQMSRFFFLYRPRDRI
jgi:hypothetical protein